MLEHVMKNMDRIPIGIMNSYHHNTINVFDAAQKFRKKKAEGRLARRSWTEVSSAPLLACSPQYVAVGKLSAQKNMRRAGVHVLTSTAGGDAASARQGEQTDAFFLAAPAWLDAFLCSRQRCREHPSGCG